LVLRNTITGICKTYNKYQETIESIGTIEAFETIVNEFEEACESYIRMKEDEEDKFKRKLLSYIEEHYHNSELSLDSLATEFGVSENYIYYYFRDKMGETFATAVQRIRINKSMQLLKETDYTVSSISEIVGYTNSRTFRRAFKRVIGYTANEYRERLDEFK